MTESVYGTPQSLSGTRNVTQRRAKKTPFSSPYQVIDLKEETADSLKNKLLEAEAIIKDLREERDHWQEELLTNENLNESVIIERSNRVSTQETRIYRRDVTMLEEDLRVKQAKISDLQETRLKLEAENQRLTETLKISEGNREEEQREFAALRERFHTLEEQLVVATNEISVLKDKLNRKIQEVADLRSKFETDVESFETRIATLNEKVKAEAEERTAQEQMIYRLRQQVRKLEDKLEEKENSARQLAETEQTQKVLSEVRQLSDRLEFLTPVRKTKDREQEEFLQLSAKVIEESMSDLKRRNARLEKELLEKKEVLKAKEDELETLHKTMSAAMGDSEQATRYLQEENTKLTRQKADIRCDLLEARRQLSQFDQKREELERQRDEALEAVRRITEEKSRIEEELAALKTSETRRDEEMDQLRARLAGFEVMRREYEAMKADLAKNNEKLSQLGKHLVMADNQCQQYKDRKEAAERSRRRAIEQCNELIARNRQLESSLEAQRKLECEVETLRSENERQTKKIAFMKEELEEMHLDYRQELAKMAAKEEKSKDQSEAVTNLRLIISQKEAELRRIHKNVEELNADNRRLQKMLDEERQQQQKPLEENVRLRKGLADALEKIEVYKRNWMTVQETCEQLEREKGEKEARVNKLEEELTEKTQQVAESEQVVNYLHSQIDTKQMKQPKLGRKSTLLTTVPEVDTSVYIREAEEVQKLEDQRQELLRDLATKRRQLAEKKSNSTTDTTTVISETTVSVSSKSASELSKPLQATMRHDIPHKWKDFRHLGVLSIKCSLCFIGIPTLAKARKCAHCDVQVHASCAPRVNNTCGMPVQCATYYRENYTGGQVSEGRMNGWLRVYMDDHQGATWISSWAMMDLTRISFYTNDGADLDKPFFSVDLNKEQWVLRTGQEMPVECDDSMRASNVLMLKMPRRCLYILAPSQPSARRWAECLQTAQRKRMMLNARPASIAEFSCLLVLNSPNNLNVFKIRIIEDWYVFATQTGLFFTSISAPRNPCRIAGPSSVTVLEIMSDINCVAMVTNSNGQLALVALDSLTLAMQSTQPSIRPQVLPQFKQVHAVRYHQQHGQRFLIVADDTHLHIRKYNATRDVFSYFAEIEVPEPVTFVESASHGIVFASDTFYSVSIDASSASSNDAKVHTRRLLPAKASDFPISAQMISETEMLLAFQNYGVFVGIDGQQTRRQTIEWEKMPMEFAFTAPYLYVLHDDSIEILEIPEYSGVETKSALEECEVFECVNAHVAGKQFDGVLITVSSEDCTEVHRFSTFCGQSKKNSTKRRGVSPSNTLKRSKN